jgi:P4 family phage/plasmid primase-like protien
MSKTWQEMFDYKQPWPVELIYGGPGNKANTPSQNALIFKAARPMPLLYAADDFYTANDSGYWDLLKPDDLRAEIRKTDPGCQYLSTSAQISAMLDELKITGDVRSAAMPFEWINPPADAPSPIDLILASNGIYNVATGALMELTTDYFATGIPAWEFDANAECPSWLTFLGEVLHESFHPTMQEWFGYTLTPDTSLEKMAFLVGASRGGKGTIKNVLEQLTGEAHRGSITLNDLSGEFGLQSMIDKRLIVIPDASDTELTKRATAVERIKSITGNDALSVNRKNKPMLHNVRIPAKLTVLANRHPKFIDDSTALAIRELVFTFEKSFAGKEDVTLRDRLTAELPGIANWSIEGLKRLRQQRKFTVGEKGKAAQHQVKLSQSPALRFATECLVVTGKAEDVVPVPLAFDVYGEWALRESLSTRERRNKNDFKEDMIAALRARGVRYAANQTRWHDPFKPSGGIGERIKGRFIGVKLKSGVHPDALSPLPP